MESKERLRRLLQMLENEPNDPFLHYAVAMEYKQNLPARALQMLEHLAEFYPDYTATYYQLAEMYREQGQREKAKAVYEKGMEICRKMQDRHAFNELQRAYRAFADEEEEE